MHQKAGLGYVYMISDSNKYGVISFCICLPSTWRGWWIRYEMKTLMYTVYAVRRCAFEHNWLITNKSHWWLSRPTPVITSIWSLSFKSLFTKGLHNNIMLENVAALEFMFGIIPPYQLSLSESDYSICNVLLMRNQGQSFHSLFR